jgi:hypothetical protein
MNQEEFWMKVVEEMPEGETKEFLRRIRSDDFATGDSFWIQDFEFLVISDLDGNKMSQFNQIICIK